MQHSFGYNRFMLVSGILIFGDNASAQNNIDSQMPNIIWITSEDNSPMLGCYGDGFATTPNLDRLASQGFRYTHCYANAPVSAPTRNTILTGVYACSAGNQQMRSWYRKSDKVRFYPEFFRQRGYYCTNNPKEDYNIATEQTKNIWDESGRTAHYRNRQKGQPFFAVFNSSISHESCIHKSTPDSLLRHSPQDVTLPPYHPDTPELRHDWAQYYDKVEDMDTWVGKILKELDDSGEAENTIVFYYADHGGILARSKRYTYESGTRAPFIVRIPDKFKHLFPADQPGSAVDRLVSWVDLAPTLLSIIDVEAPDYMQGHAFLGAKKTPDPEYVYMFRGRMDERYDMTRAVRDKQYRYIRNYQPHRIYGLHNNYLWLAPSVASWEKAFRNGQCNAVQSVFWNTKPAEELYDTENDPWEINNLAADPQYAATLLRLRNAANKWMSDIRDAGFIPEGEYAGIEKTTTLYDYTHSEKYPVNEVIEMANMASDGKPTNIPKLTAGLKNNYPAIRYWAATGLLILADNAASAAKDLEQALLDPVTDVAIVAAEALIRQGQTDSRKKGIETLVNALKHHDVYVRTQALNIIDENNINELTILNAITELVNAAKNSQPEQSRYDLRLTEWLEIKN